MRALMLCANDLNQKFNNLFYSTVPITWNRRELSWSHTRNIRKLLPYYFVNVFFVIIISGTFMLIAISFSMFLVPEIFSIKQKIAFALTAIGIVPTALLIEFLIFQYGGDVSAVGNWSVKTKNMYQIPPQYDYEAGLVPTLKLELIKVLRGTRPVDWYGLFAIQTFLVMSLLSLAIPGVFTLYKLNPWDIFLFAIISPKILNFPPIQDHLITRISMYFIATSTTISCLIAVKTHFLALLPEIQFQLELLQYLLKMELSFRQLKLFREARVATKILYSLNKVGLGIFLGMVFWILLVCMNLTLLGRGLLPWDVYSLVPVIGFVFLIVLLVMFDFGCGIYEISEKVIWSWGRQIMQTTGPKRMERVLRSLQPLAIQVGEAGIMDMDIKKNYFDTLLNTFVSSMIVASDILS